jgi:hypothetical protein
MVIPARPTPLFSHSLSRRLLICLVFLAFMTSQAATVPPKGPGPAPSPGALSTEGRLSSPTFSTRAEAHAFIDKIKLPDSSAYWPRVRTHLFLENLKINIDSPLAIYQGSNTNFCGYAALSYIPLHQDPLGYTRFLVTLFIEGKATWNGVSFTPTAAVRQAAGALRFKGILDIRPADQVWFLVLADHFKGYLNFFFPNFHPGSEDTFWASVNYSKFNRIIRQLFKYKVESKGSDLIRPHLPDIYGYLNDRVHTGTTYLYVNNTYLEKKYHSAKAPFPTHYIVLTDIWKTGDLLTLVYWDYGIKSLRQVSPAFLRKITFGVTHCTIPENGQ